MRHECGKKENMEANQALILNSHRLKELSNNGKRRVFYYFTQDASRLYPAFGLEKIALQSRLRSIHHQEGNARPSKALHKLADLTATPEKEADWAIVGGLAQGIGGVGAAGETACMGIRIPGGLGNVSFKPLALWEIVDGPDGLSPARRLLSQLPADSRLHAEWTRKAKAHLKLTEQLQKGRRAASIKTSHPVRTSDGLKNEVLWERVFTRMK